jgi:diguanylate cyclase (GGDEF)-like protein
MLARRHQRPIALVYIDVDDLKMRNDTYGHEAGDAMLIEFADATRAEARASDLVARLGGDEFALLLPETDAAEAEIVVERLRARLLASDVLPIRFSAGIAAGVPVANRPGPIDKPEDVEALVRRADLLMLEAKQQGKGLTVTGSLLALP